jgi:polar amino acid transport system substrate-binding protein
MRRGLPLVLVALAASGCASFPHDPEGTLRRVQGGKLRVGLVEAPPWVVRTAGEPAGAEVELARQLAADLGATPEWVWGGEQRHMEALERFELDLVVGGLTDDTPWDARVGLTGPYFEDRVLVGFADTPPGALDGVTVAVRAGDPAAGKLRRKGAVPEVVADLKQARPPLAAPDWRLEQLGLWPADVELQKRKHVMAVPPGENGWLRRVEEFLHARGPEVRDLLNREVARP